MKKFWPGLFLVCALALPASARAADRTTVGVGTGAVAGALVGGPIGAVLGAVAGGVIGANSGRLGPGARRRVRVAHRRRSAFPAKPRAALAARGGAAANPIRPVSATIPARPASAPGTGRAAETVGGGWKDPH